MTDSEILYAYKKARKLSVRGLAREMGCDGRFVRRVLAGQKPLRDRVLIADLMVAHVRKCLAEERDLQDVGHC